MFIGLIQSTSDIHRSHFKACKLTLAGGSPTHAFVPESFPESVSAIARALDTKIKL
jgi:hypothetical protein